MLGANDRGNLDSMTSATQLRAQRPRIAVVLVDDEALASALVELLRDLSWETYEVESFRDARVTIESVRAGVFVVDPGLHVDLLERFVAKLASTEGGPGVVVLSDLLSAASIADQHGVVFVQEPFDLDDFAAAVERARHTDYDLSAATNASTASTATTTSTSASINKTIRIRST